MTMQDLQQRELQRCLKFIAAVGCKYAVVTQDGQEFISGLTLAKPEEETQRHRRYRYGDLLSIYKDRIDVAAPIGYVQEIDCGEIEPRHVQSSLTGYLTAKWGAGCYSTTTSGTKIYVLRKAEPENQPESAQ